MNEVVHMMKHFGATRIWTPVPGGVRDLVSGVTPAASGLVGGAALSNARYIREQKFHSFGGSGTPYMDGATDYADTGDSSCVNEMDSDAGGGKGFSFTSWINYHGQNPISTDSFFGARVTSGGGDVPNFTCISHAASGSTVRFRVIVQSDAGSSKKRDWNNTTGFETANGPVMIGAAIDWTAGTIVMYVDGVAVAHSTVIAAGSLGVVAGNDKNVYIGCRNDDGTAATFCKVGMGVIGWYGGTKLSATQFAQIFRASKAPPFLPGRVRMLSHV